MSLTGGSNHRSNAPALLQIAAVVGFLLPLILAANILIRVFDAPVFTSLMIAAVCGAVGSRVVGHMVEKKLLQAEEDEKRMRREERETDTQKQIDAMLRNNSKIPKVKR